MATVDVLIAGGGVMGSAIAYFLAADPDFTGHVQVVEPDPSYQFASSPRSLGGVRQQFSNLENIQIGLFGHHFVTHVDHYLTVDGEAPALSFREGGYLFLASAEGLATLRENHAVQTAAGAAIDLLSPDDLAARFPWIDVAGLAGASLSAGGEGWLDPFALLLGFRKKARALGVEFIADKVTGVRRANGRVTAVDLASGTRVAPGVLVNAAGAWAGEVAAQAGVALPVEPRRRMVYVFECRTPLNPPPPLTI
ncbi:MAG: FAD-dependent oxidoreductase, partial [Pseudomonadota bacterium]|nr:FAD-dependent oxidoreductase [Pseudomonadota bacterium]